MGGFENGDEGEDWLLDGEWNGGGFGGEEGGRERDGFRQGQKLTAF